MEVKSIKELDKIIQLCRKRGVNSIEISGIRVVLSPEAPRSNYLKTKSKEEGTSLQDNYQEYLKTLLWSSTNQQDFDPVANG